MVTNMNTASTWITTVANTNITATTDGSWVDPANGSIISWLDPGTRYVSADMTWIEEPPRAAPAPRVDPPSPLSRERRVRLR